MRSTCFESWLPLRLSWVRRGEWVTRRWKKSVSASTLWIASRWRRKWNIFGDAR